MGYDAPIIQLPNGDYVAIYPYGTLNLTQMINAGISGVETTSLINGPKKTIPEPPPGPPPPPPPPPEPPPPPPPPPILPNKVVVQNYLPFNTADFDAELNAAANMSYFEPLTTIPCVGTVPSQYHSISDPNEQTKYNTDPIGYIGHSSYNPGGSPYVSHDEGNRFYPIISQQFRGTVTVGHPEEISVDMSKATFAECLGMTVIGVTNHASFGDVLITRFGLNSALDNAVSIELSPQPNHSGYPYTRVSMLLPAIGNTRYGLSSVFTNLYYEGGWGVDYNFIRYLSYYYATANIDFGVNPKTMTLQELINRVQVYEPSFGTPQTHYEWDGLVDERNALDSLQNFYTYMTDHSVESSGYGYKDYYYVSSPSTLATINVPFTPSVDLTYYTAKVRFNMFTTSNAVNDYGNPETLTVTNTTKQYPYDVYLTSVDIVPDTKGMNGYSSVSFVDTSTKLHLVYSAGGNVTGYDHMFNVTMRDVYYPNMRLNYNFIDANGKGFSIVSDDPLIEVDIGLFLCGNQCSIRVPSITNPVKANEYGVPIYDNATGNIIRDSDNSYLMQLVYAPSTFNNGGGEGF